MPQQLPTVVRAVSIQAGNSTNRSLMKILGLNYFGHDSSVALVIDDKVISAVEEERFSRIKYDSAFPKLSINYCLENSNLNLSEIDVVALSFIPEKWIQGGAGLFASLLPRFQASFAIQN